MGFDCKASDVLSVLQQLEKLIKHRELEQQLADTKLQQAAIILKEEKERNLKEKELVSSRDSLVSALWSCWS